MLYETIIPNRGSSILKKSYMFKYFPPNWHYHPEHELLIITEGSGRRFVNNSVTAFHQGDVVLIGSNVPHFHLSDPIYYQSNDYQSNSQVIQFVPEVFPPDMQNLPGFQDIQELLQRGKWGVLFNDSELQELVLTHFNQFEYRSGLDRLIELYRILEQLAHSTDYTLLSVEPQPQTGKPLTDDMTVSLCYKYLLDHFKEDISLQQVADYVDRNPSALCRSFKSATGRTMFNCLTEIRMDHAFRLLTTTNFTVSRIARESGFVTISNFNHKFQKLTRLSPLEYRTQSRINLNNY